MTIGVDRDGALVVTISVCSEEIDGFAFFDDEDRTVFEADISEPLGKGTHRLNIPTTGTEANSFLDLDQLDDKTRIRGSGTNSDHKGVIQGPRLEVGELKDLELGEVAYVNGDYETSIANERVGNESLECE